MVNQRLRVGVSRKLSVKMYKILIIFNWERNTWVVSRTNHSRVARVQRDDCCLRWWTLSGKARHHSGLQCDFHSQGCYGWRWLDRPHANHPRGTVKCAVADIRRKRFWALRNVESIRASEAWHSMLSDMKMWAMRSRQISFVGLYWAADRICIT